jgi:hypothetical protein
MAFYFALGTVLRVRGIVEDQEERTLQTILFQISQAQDAISCIEEDIARSNEARSTEILKPSLGLNIHASYGELAELKRRKDEYDVRIRQLEEQRNRQLAVYKKAHRDREMLTDMRDAHLSTYESGLAREAQKAVDDNFSARRGRA